MLATAGEPGAWRRSAAWWPVTATLTNLVTVGLLAALLRGEGSGLRRLYLPPGGHPGRDLLLALGLLVLALPVAYGPNVGTALLLFGDPMAPVHMFVQPLPAPAAATALVAFPATIALAELPLYFGYGLPRLRAAWGSGAKAVLATATFLAAQHVTLPLILETRFVVWRLVMFFPFALLLGEALRRRPTLLPYLMVAHGLLDASVAWMVFDASV